MSDISLHTWHRIADQIELPIPADEMVDTWEAASPYQAETLAAMWHTAAIGKIDADAKNPFRLRTSGSFYGQAVFDSWSDAIKTFIENEDWRTYTTHSDTSPHKVAGLTQHILDVDKLPPPVLPPDPSDPLEPRLSELIEWFGPIRKYQPDGPVSQAWLSWCRSNGVFPTLVQINGEAGRTIYSFANGLRILWDGETATPMRLIRNSTDEVERTDP
jgi:hypothetical protein